MKIEKFNELLYIIMDTPKQRIFDINHFEDEIQADLELKATWDEVFNEIPIEIADTIVNDTDIDARISNAVDAQTDYYQTTGLIFNSNSVYDGYVLPMTYFDIAKLLTALQISN